KTDGENHRVLKLFVDMVGQNKKITSINAGDMQAFQSALLKLPPNFSKVPQFKGLSVQQVLVLCKDSKPLNPTTAKKYFLNVRSFMLWCQAQGHIEGIPAPNMKMPKPPAGKTRAPFDSKRLESLFSSPLFTGHKSESRRASPGQIVTKDAKFWIPIIGLLSGMRLGEIVQLRLTDVKTEQGITYFDVSKGEFDQESDKQIKTLSSVRKIPLHPDLLTGGFLEFVAARKNKAKDSTARLFHEIAKGSDGYYSHNFSKWFSRYLSDISVKSPLHVFHSLRHNFKDALQHAGVETSCRMQLMGHKEIGTHAGYGSNQLPLSSLVKAIAQIAPPAVVKKLLVP
ncbi:MAG: site-specific integrase, partial [Deltaproteobacteria bacterium]|nr:site-specific integrase [Deltaproteobacteria bacterium]